MPDAPDPETLPTAEEIAAPHAELFPDPGVAERLLKARAAVDLRYVRGPAVPHAPGRPRRAALAGVVPHQRQAGRHADDPMLHICLATYVSDMTLLDSVLLAHGRGGWAVGDVVGASLDHAMWFHRPFRADEWLLYDQESPSASGRPGPGHGADLDPRRPPGRLGHPGGPRPGTARRTPPPRVSRRLPCRRPEGQPVSPAASSR